MRARGSLFWRALSIITERLKMCSIVPLIPLRRPFCKDGLIILFSRRNSSRRVVMILFSSFPTTDVSAIGLKFAGLEVSPPL